jgi:hypothetical protein
MTAFRTAQLCVTSCVSSCAGSVMHLNALPRRTRRFLDLDGLNAVMNGLSAVMENEWPE